MRFPEATDPFPDRGDLLATYLDYFRERIIGKVSGLPEGELRTSRVPSGWTPISLLKHLRYVELRWVEWGYEGREVAHRGADLRDDKWYAAPDETLDDLVAALRKQGELTRAVATSGDLSAPAKPGKAWEGEEPAALDRILLHLIQEYAHHAGHIDIVVELAEPAAQEGG